MSAVPQNQIVRLKEDVPNLGLCRGETGVICASWFSPINAYEVEFNEVGLRGKTRAVLLEWQIEPRGEDMAQSLVAAE